jgi:hypothetical protein
MMLDMKVTGLKSARRMMAFMAFLGAEYRGIEKVGKTRSSMFGYGITTNADVQEFLAEGGRDLGPAEDDAENAAQAYVDTVMKHLTFMKKGKVNVPAAERQAQAKALRAAAMAVSKIMVNRIEKSEDMDGPADEVTEEYAKARARKFSMSDDQSQAFKASGQLLADYAGRGGLRLVK